MGEHKTSLRHKLVKILQTVKFYLKAAVAMFEEKVVPSVLEDFSLKRLDTNLNSMDNQGRREQQLAAWCTGRSGDHHEINPGSFCPFELKDGSRCERDDIPGHGKYCLDHFHGELLTPEFQPVHSGECFER